MRKHEGLNNKDPNTHEKQHSSAGLQARAGEDGSGRPWELTSQLAYANQGALSSLGEPVSKMSKKKEEGTLDYNLKPLHM